LIIVSIIIGVLINYFRFWVDYVDGITLFLGIPCFGVLFILLILCLIGTIYNCFKYKQLLPIIIFIVCMILAFTLQPMNLPEESIFIKHRTKYELLVEMARNGMLTNSPDCTGSNRFAYPEGYSELVITDEVINCIIIETKPTLVVEFIPRDYYYRIVYIEDKNIIDDKIPTCTCNDGTIIKWLDNNWLICRLDWN